MRLAPLLLLAVASCSRREPPPAPTPAESVPSPATAPPAAPPVTPLGVCNKLLASGAVEACTVDTGGSTASFHKGKGRGVINIARDRTAYARIMNNVDFGDRLLAASLEKLVIVYWTTTGSDASDALIRTVVETM